MQIWTAFFLDRSIFVVVHGKLDHLEENAATEWNIDEKRKPIRAGIVANEFGDDENN